MNFLSSRTFLLFISLSSLAVYAPPAWSAKFSNTATVSAPGKNPASSTATALQVRNYKFLKNTATVSATDKRSVSSSVASQVVSYGSGTHAVPTLPLWAVALLIIAIVTAKFRRRRIFYN